MLNVEVTELLEHVRIGTPVNVRPFRKSADE